jgi:two-component system sensor histidine kinase YesM
MIKLSKPRISLINRFSNMKLSKKFLIGYFMIVFIPYLIITGAIYVKVTDDMLSQYNYNQKSILENNRNNFIVKLSQIESLSSIFRYNTEINHFLSGYENTKENEILSYLSFRNEFTYASNIYNTVESINIYRANDGYAKFTDYIKPREALKEFDSIKWDTWAFVKKDNLFKYYTVLYDQSTLREIGILEITIKPPELFSDFIAEKNTAVVFNIGSQTIFFNNDAFYHTYELSKEKQAHSIFKDKFITNTCFVSTLNLTITKIQKYNDVMNTGYNYFYIFAILLLLTFLSVLYYLFAFTITSRIVSFSNHIRNKCTDTNLMEYESPGNLDEVGNLIKTFNKMVYRINNLIQSNYIAEIERKNAEFHALQSQINPHFLYNTLECVRMTAETNDDTEVSEMIYILGKYMRYNITRKPDSVLLSKELENITRYFDLIKFRKEDKFNYNIVVKCDINELVCPFFILQPIVENCIVHGFNKTNKVCTIQITVYEENSFIIIKVEDNGIGIEPGRLRHIAAILEDSNNDLPPLNENKNSVGLENVNQRIKHFYHENCGLSIQSEYGEGTICYLKIVQIKENSNKDCS